MIYSLQAPDGNIYDLEAPEGSSEQQLTATLYHLKPEAAVAPKTTSAGFSLSDLGRAAGSGVAGGLQALAGVAGANNPVSNYLGDVSKNLQEGLSPERKAEMQARQAKIAAAEKTGSTWEQIKAGLGAVAEAPLQSLATGAGSMVTPLAAGAAAIALAPEALVGYLGANVLSRVAIGTVGAAMGSGQSKQDIFDRVKKEYMDAKVSEAEAEKKAMLAQNWVGKNIDQIAINAGTGALEAATGVGRVLAPGKAAVKAAVKAPSLLKTIGAVGLEEAAPEVAQSLSGTAATNVAASREGFEAPTFQGAAAPAAESGLTAFLLGSATGPKEYLGKRGEYEFKQKTLEQQRAAEETAAAPKPPDITDPAYLQQIQTQYQEAEKRKADLRSQLRKVKDGSVTETADRLHNKDIEDQIKAMTPELEQLAAEYNKASKVAPAFTPEAVPGPVPEAVKAPEVVKPTLTVGDALDSPLGRFTKEELSSRSPDVVNFVDEHRKKLGKPALNDYSIEDIRDAMPGELPDAEKADLNSLIAAKTGYTPDVTYKPEDIINVAKQKNIATDTDGFKFFLQRATGDNDLSKMEQPQLHSAFTALSGLPEFNETQYLPEKTSATDYSPQQYNAAVQQVSGLASEKDIPSAQALQVAKKATGLTRDSDVQLLLQNAYTNGDLNLSSKGDFITAQPAEQAEFKVEEGFTQGEPTGFNVMRGDELLYSTQNQDEANAKVESLSKTADPAVKQIDKSIASERSTIAASQRSLDIMEAGGMFRTPKYQQASAQHAALVQKANENIQRLNEKKVYLQQPITIQTTGKPSNVKVYKAKEKGVSEKAFNTREEALKHALENLPAARLNELAGKTKAPGFAKRLQAEIERRRNPPKPFLAAKPEPKVEAKPEKTAEKEAIKSQLIPMLKKFGLGDVALQIEEGMKAEGSYAASVIKVALDANNPVRVLRHESIHGLKDLGFFTPGQWKVLENQADKVWIDKYLKQRNINGQPIEGGQQSRYEAYQNLYDGDMDAIREEAIADAFGDFDVNGAPKGLFATLLQKMQDFFRALRSAFTGAGYETADDVFGKVERGELKATKQAGAKEKPSLIRKAVEDEKEIATQNPQAKGRLYDPLTDMLSIDEAAVRESMEQNPELERNIIDAIKSYGFIPVNTKDEDVIKVFKDNIVNNLLHLYKRVPKDVRERSKLWYDGANKIASELADRYDMEDTQVAGILAAMSPQKDWFQNVSMAERAIDILTNYGDSTWTPKMLQYAESYINEAEDRADREGRQIFFDKRIKKMNDNQVKLKDMGIKEAAAFVRAYDEAFHDRKYNIVTPEGGFGGTVMNKNPDPDTGLFKPATMMWSTYSPIEKTVSIFREPTRKNISEKLGEEHKIRSFYNNIIAPNSPIGHVTIDTHAVAAGLYEALAGSDPEVAHNFGGVGKNTKIGVGGTYGIIADAYREAAAKVGLKPREMQSVTWEAVRGMFPENIKSQIKQKVRDEWTKYRTGEQTFEKARSNIEAIGDRADSPDWVNSDEGTFVEDGGSSFDASFTPEGGVRLRKANEIKEKATVNLSAVTGTIPGLQELHTRALNGDASAYETLQKVATSTLRFLLSGTKAKISFQPIKGVYEEGREPAIMVQVNFRESESEQVLAALSKFGRNFNQEAIHVRTKTKYKAGHNFDDGSYATPVYTIPLKNELTEKDIVDIVNTSGLKGFSVSKTELIAYHVQGKYNDISEYDSFLDIVRGVHATYGAKDKRLQQGVQRLAVYGDGYGARTSYQDIASDLQTKQLADRETPRIIAEYLNQHPIKPFEQKPLTKAQKAEQTVLKDIYQALPVNDLKKPIVRKAYAALAQEVKRQYETLPIKVQLTVARKDADGNYIDIYKNSAEVRKDVSLNNRFKVLKTEPNTFGPEGADFSGHPLLENSGLKDVSGKPMLYNDLLRAVHDYFAHNLSDTEFGPKGEFAAWKNHMATTKDPLARWALTQETRAQNAWQNFRPEAQNLTLKERGFADQKAALPPATFALTGDLNVDAPMIKFIEGLDGNQKLGSLSPRSPLVSQIPTLPQTEKLSLRTAPDTPEFKRWFGNSKIVTSKYTGPVSGTNVMDWLRIPEDEQADYWKDLTQQKRDALTQDYRNREGVGNPKIMYHGTARDITTFKPKQAGAIFLTDDIDFAEGFASMSADWMAKNVDEFLTPQQKKDAVQLAIKNVKADYGKTKASVSIIKDLQSGNPTGEAMDKLVEAYREMMPSGPNVMPVYVRAEKPFDYENPDHIRAIEAKSSYGLPINEIITGRWQTIESKRIQELIKEAGFDSFYVSENGRKNLAVYDSSQIKSATGNIGTYDINNPDIRYSLRDAPDWVPQKIWDLHKKVNHAEDLASGRIASNLRPQDLKREQTMSFRRLNKAVEDYVGKDFNDVNALMVRMNEETGRREREQEDRTPTRYSLRTDVTKDIDSLPNGAAINAAINRVTTARQEVGYVERMTTALAGRSETFSYLRQKALDRYNRLNDFDKLVAQQMGGVAYLADQSAHAAALQSDAAAGVAASALGVGNRMGGTPVYRNGYTTVSNENGTVKGAVEIFSPLAKYGNPRIYQAYQFWAGAKRGKRLLASGKEELYTPQDMAYAKELEQQYPEFVNVQKDWIKYNDGLVKYAVDTGVISAQNAAEFVRYSDYVPFYRQLEGERTVGPNIFQSISGVKGPQKITGSEAPLADFLETVVRNTQSIIQAGMKNVAAQKAVKGGMTLQMVRKLDYVASGPNTVTILEKGQKVSYECADKLWVDAVSSLNLPELPFLNFLAMPANFLRSAVTKDPGFMLANLMRDSVSAYVTSGAKLTPVASAVKEMGNVLMNNSPEYQKLLSAGVLGGYEFSRNVEASAEAFAKDLRKKTGTKTSFESATSPFTFFWDALEKGTEASDAATRIAVYKATLAETGNEAEAIHRALEVMNFNRKGSSAVVRIAAAAIPFLNARVQGLDVFFRAGIRPFMDANATEQEKQVQKAMIIRGMTLLGLSVMYAMAISGNPDYEKQEEETKDNNWIIPMGEGKTPLKIPIPFEVGTLFKTIPERIYRSFFMENKENRDTTEDLQKSMRRALQSTFGLNPVPQIAAPLLEARDNYSVFTQRPIVGQNMQGIAPEFQVGPGTSKWAEILGQQAGMSPMMIDHVFKGYTGTMGVYAADLLDAGIEAVSPSGIDKPSKRIEQMPIIKRFLADPEARGKITSYFDLKHAVDTTVRTINKLEKEADPNLPDYVEKNAQLFAARDFMNGLNKQMDELQQQANMIRAASIPADEKRDMLMEITKAQNLLVNDIRQIRNIIRP